MGSRPEGEVQVGLPCGGTRREMNAGPRPVPVSAGCVCSRLATDLRVVSRCAARGCRPRNFGLFGQIGHLYGPQFLPLSLRGEAGAGVTRHLVRLVVIVATHALGFQQGVPNGQWEFASGVVCVESDIGRPHGIQYEH